MAALLRAANVAAHLPQDLQLEDLETSAETPAGDQLPQTMKEEPQQQQHEQTTSNSKRQRNRKKGNKNVAKPAQAGEAVAKPNGDAAREVATLAKLQSYFRVRNGFKVLESHIKVRCLKHPTAILMYDWLDFTLRYSHSTAVITLTWISFAFSFLYFFQCSLVRQGNSIPANYYTILFIAF